jgi:hypothetical protein
MKVWTLVVTTPKEWVAGRQEMVLEGGNGAGNGWYNGELGSGFGDGCDFGFGKSNYGDGIGRKSGGCLYGEEIQ